MTFLLRLLATAAALWVATRIVPGISFRGDNYVALLGVAFVFGVVNAIVRPLLTILSFPVVVLTLGLFLFVINGLMLLLTSFLSGRLGIGFHVDGIIAAMLGSLVVSITAAVLQLLLGSDKD